MLYTRGNFKNVTIDLAIYSHSAQFAVHFNCAEQILHLREEHKHMTIVQIFF